MAAVAESIRQLVVFVVRRLPRVRFSFSFSLDVAPPPEPAPPKEPESDEERFRSFEDLAEETSGRTEQTDNLGFVQPANADFPQGNSGFQVSETKPFQSPQPEPNAFQTSSSNPGCPPQKSSTPELQKSTVLEATTSTPIANATQTSSDFAEEPETSSTSTPSHLRGFNPQTSDHSSGSCDPADSGFESRRHPKSDHSDSEDESLFIDSDSEPEVPHFHKPPIIQTSL